VRVHDEHFGASIVPLYEYEDKNWSGSCVKQTPGRSSSSVYLYTHPDTGELCFVKSDTHICRHVTCLGGAHFGETVKCCVEVREHWNRLHPDDSAQFVPEHRRPVVVNPPDSGGHIEDICWPHDCSNNLFTAKLCMDWSLRNPNSEWCVDVFFCFCLHIFSSLLSDPPFHSLSLDLG
jgi:hypothetical protein